MRKTLLIGALAVAGLAGCASGPYDSYGYGPGYDPYYYGGYAPDYYSGPSVGFGYYYFDGGDGNRHFRGDHHWRDNDGRWQGRGDNDRGDRGGWRGDTSVGGNVGSFHGEMGNEAGSGRGGGGGGGHGGGGQQ